MRLTSVVRALGACAVLATAPLEAGAQIQPFAIYTFAGCWEGVSCHTAEVAVGASNSPWLPGQLAMGFRITSTYEAGAMAVTRLAYQVTAASGSTKQSALFDDDVYIATFCPSIQFPAARTTCVDGTGLYQIAAQASFDYVPGSFNVGTRRGTPGAPDVTTVETRWLQLPLVSVTQVVPEPSTVALVGSGLASLAGGAWRRRRASYAARNGGIQRKGRKGRKGLLNGSPLRPLRPLR